MARAFLARLFVAAIFLFSAPPAAVLAQPQPVDVNAILSITGGNAFVGSAYQQTLSIVEKYVNAHGGINGRPLHFVIADDQSSPQVDIPLVNALIAQHVPIIIHSGPLASCKAIEPLIVAAGPVLYCLTPAYYPATGSYGFSTWTATDEGTRALINFFREKGWKRLGVITPVEATGQAADHALQEILKRPENSTMQIVDYEHFAPSAINVDAEIQKIRASNPQAVLTFGTGGPTGTVFRSLKNAGIDLPVGAGSNNQTYSEMEQFASFLPRQFYQYSQLWPEYRQLRGGPVKDAMGVMYAAYKAAGIRPDLGASASWDPILIVVQALRKLGPTTSAPALRDYILNLRDYAGINGFYDFRVGNQRGLTIKDVIVVRWDTGVQTWLPVSGPAGELLR